MSCGRRPWRGRIFQPEEIRAVARAFPRKTAMTDGWHPRHVLWLSKSALVVLGLLFAIAEVCGDYPAVLRETTVRVITAKRRPIGLFRGLVRLHGKLLVPEISAWQAWHADDPCFATGKGQATPEMLKQPGFTFARDGHHSAEKEAAEQQMIDDSLPAELEDPP